MGDILFLEWNNSFLLSDHWWSNAYEFLIALVERLTSRPRSSTRAPSSSRTRSWRRSSRWRSFTCSRWAHSWRSTFLRKQSGTYDRGKEVGISKFWMARARLYRSRFLQSSRHMKARFEIYKICNPLHCSDRKIWVKNASQFWRFWIIFSKLFIQNLHFQI